MIWLDGYDRLDLGPDGGPYDTTAARKLCWHTTEGSTLAAAEAAFGPYPPHLGVDPRTGECHQYVPLDRHSYAFASSESDDSAVIQVEVVGFAGESHNWTASTLQWLAVSVVRPVQLAVGVPPVVCPQGFHGEGEGIILASPDSPIRFASTAALDAFAGHVGHQHMPAPDAHWDPGRLDVNRILELAGDYPLGHPEQESEDDMALTICRARSGDPQYVTDLCTFKTPIANPAARDALVWCTIAAGGKLYYNPDVNDPVIVPDELLDPLPTVGG